MAKDAETESTAAKAEPAKTEAVKIATDAPAATFTVERHAESMSLDWPTFAAVLEYQGWARGKQTTMAAFAAAVKEFLGAPIGTFKERVK